MRCAAKSNIVGSLALAVSLAAAMLALTSFGPAATAGAITDVTPPSQTNTDGLDFGEKPSGPMIEFGLSPTRSDAQSASPDSGLDDSDQSYAPWMVQDDDSLDWFGNSENVLQSDTNGADTTSQQAAALLQAPPVHDTSDMDESIPSSSSQDQLDRTLGHTLGRLVSRILEGLGFAASPFVFVPIAILVLVIGLPQIVKLLRVSQGLDPVKGRQRWGIKRSGEFGPLSESNDNRKRSRRRRRNAA